MSQIELTVLARFPSLMVRNAAARGIDPDELLRGVGLRERDLQDLDRGIAVRKMERLWQRLITLIPDPDLGVTYGASVTARQLGLVGYTMLASRTLGGALERLRRFSHILTEAVQIELSQGRDGVAMLFDSPAGLVTLRHPIDGRLAIVMAVAREITGVHIRPLRVRFPYEVPSDDGALRRFFEAPLQFGAARAALVMAPSDIERPVIAGDEALAGYLDEYAALVLESFAQPGSLSEQVQRTLATELSGGRPNLRHIASHLHLSERTLQRRLKAEGTSFATLVDSSSCSRAGASPSRRSRSSSGTRASANSIVHSDGGGTPRRTSFGAARAMRDELRLAREARELAYVANAAGRGPD